jgi:hypothetical protein
MKYEMRIKTYHLRDNNCLVPGGKYQLPSTCTHLSLSAMTAPFQVALCVAIVNNCLNKNSMRYYPQ